MSYFLILATGFMLPWSAQAVDFSFTDTEGNSHRLADYRGKWVVVNYWASWCSTCIYEIPELSNFHLRNDYVVVIGVNYEPELTDRRLQTLTASYLIQYPVTRVSKEITRAVGVPNALPTSYLINPSGEVVEKIVGLFDGERIKQLRKPDSP